MSLNRFIAHGQLKDKKIVDYLRRAADDFENGEIWEVRDLLLEIVGAIEEFSDGEE